MERVLVLNASYEPLNVCTVRRATVLVLIPMTPKALALPGLAKVNQQLQKEIAEREWAQEELRGSRDQLEAILRGVADGITAQDSTGRIIYANEAAARLIGFPLARDLAEVSIQNVMERFELLDEAGNPFPLEGLPGRRALAGEEGVEDILRFRVIATGTIGVIQKRIVVVLKRDGETLLPVYLKVE